MPRKDLGHTHGDGPVRRGFESGLQCFDRVDARRQEEHTLVSMVADTAVRVSAVRLFATLIVASATTALDTSVTRLPHSHEEQYRQSTSSAVGGLFRFRDNHAGLEPTAGQHFRTLRRLDSHGHAGEVLRMASRDGAARGDRVFVRPKRNQLSATAVVFRLRLLEGVDEGRS